MFLLLACIWDVCLYALVKAYTFLQKCYKCLNAHG